MSKLSISAWPAILGITFSAVLQAQSIETPRRGEGQLGTEITWFDVPDSRDLVHAIQFTRDGRLFLTPNESFFPRKGLTATGSGTVPDVASLNGDNSFSQVEKWDPGDAMEWGIWSKATGSLDLDLVMSGGSESSRFTLSLGEQSKTFTVRSGTDASRVEKINFTIDSPGRHLVRLTCDEGGAGAAMHWIEVSGPAARDGGVLRKRWRPAAAHTKFSNSRSPGKIRLWVMEMDAVPGELDFYCPITTPFGYYGPTWKADGTVNTGFNFSLWSFGRGKPEPPVEQLSHLLAIGSPEASFDGFDHEGTGVKIRDWEPLAGRQGQRQALALRVQPGDRYDTYFSYFYAADEKRWRLFGVGNKWNNQKPVESLWVGSFVEVPGPPPVQRTGAWERRMRYRGWIMDEKGSWYSLDRMAGGNVSKETGLTHTDRGVTEDGWFYLETGGWAFRKVGNTNEAELRDPVAPSEVDFLQADDIAFLTSLPCSIEAAKLERADSRARVTYSVRNAGKSPQVTIYWGNAEGLSLAERWPNQAEVTESIVEGENQFVFEGIPEGEPLLIRLLLKNEEGQFWSSETASAAP